MLTRMGLAPIYCVQRARDAGCGARGAGCAKDGQDRADWFSVNPRAV